MVTVFLLLTCYVWLVTWFMWVWIILKSCISSAASSDWVCQTVVIKLQLNVLVYQPGGCQRAIITPAPIRWNYPEIGLWLISPAYIYQLMWYWPSMNIFMYWKQSSRFNLVRINWFTEQLEKVSLSPPWVAQTRFQSKVGCCQKQHQEVIWKQDFRTIVPVLEGRSYQFPADLSMCTILGMQHHHQGPVSRESKESGLALGRIIIWNIWLKPGARNT